MIAVHGAAGRSVFDGAYSRGLVPIDDVFLNAIKAGALRVSPTFFGAVEAIVGTWERTMLLLLLAPSTTTAAELRYSYYSYSY